MSGYVMIVEKRQGRHPERSTIGRMIVVQRGLVAAEQNVFERPHIS